MIRKFHIGVSVILLSVVVSGCIPLILGAAAGAGGIAYIKGSLEQNIDEPVEAVHQASLDALKDLDIFVIADELNRHSAVINAEYADGESIKINIAALTEYVSKISIRVGVLGDQEESVMILNAIEKNL